MADDFPPELFRHVIPPVIPPMYCRWLGNSVQRSGGMSVAFSDDAVGAGAGSDVFANLFLIFVNSQQPKINPKPHPRMFAIANPPIITTMRNPPPMNLMKSESPKRSTGIFRSNANPINATQNKRFPIRNPGNVPAVPKRIKPAYRRSRAKHRSPSPSIKPPTTRTA